MVRHYLIAGMVCLILAAAAPGQGGEETPVLRLEAGGPTSLITGMVFSSDGQTLYAAGWDKLVRVWQRKGTMWVEEPAFRVPLGPGADGKLNAIALSSDGNWLAVAGSALIRARTGFKETGFLIPSQALDGKTREDQGVITLFHTKTREVKTLRGLRGAIFTLAFANAGDPKTPPALAAAGRHWNEDSNQFQGALWVWEPSQEKPSHYPKSLPDLRELQLKRPAVVLERRNNQLKIDFAWGDGKIRTWTPGADPIETDAGKLNATLVSLGNDQVLAGSMQNAMGYLQAWKQAQPFSAPAWPTNPPAMGYVPLALVATPNHILSAVFAKGTGNPQVRLHAIPRAGPLAGKLTIDRLLWTYNSRLPVLAADPAGKSIAIAGQDNDSIQIYSLAELAQGQKPQQILSRGTLFRYAAFLRNKDAFGLILSETPKKKPGDPPRSQLEVTDLVFDFQKPGLASPTGWFAESPALVGWQAVHENIGTEKVGQSRLKIQGPNFERALPFKPESEEKITEWALLPPSASRPFPVLAVALLEIGEPALRLYRLDTGKQLRQFTGHDGPIRSLAFSANGKLLVSAADDQTVRVWSLADLEKSFGLIPGLALKGTLVAEVAKIDPDSPAAGKLRVGDVLESVLLPDQKKEPIPSALGFYQALRTRKAGEKIQVAVKNGGTFAFTLDPAIEEHHPLITLFITRGRLEEREWLGWNPQGPYEASSPKAERYLGWHVNTGKEDNPVAFARAEKYREKYEKRGILKTLAATGNLAQAIQHLPRPVLPDPRILVTVGDVVMDPSQRDPRGNIPVPTINRTVRVKIYDFPLDKLQGVEWALDDGHLEALEKSAENEFTADLPGEARRGIHTLRILARTPEAKFPEYAQNWKIRLQPPPPTLTSDLPRRSFVAKETFPLEAQAQPGMPGENLVSEVLVNQKSVGQFVGTTIKTPLELGKGNHTIEILTRHKDALKGYEADESARLALEVVYNPKAPQIALDEALPLPAKGEGTPIKIQPGEPLVLDNPRVRVKGTVSSTEELQEISFDGKPLPDFRAGAMKQPVDVLVELEPGGRKIVLTAKTRNTSAQQQVELRYHPKLPRLLFLPGLEGTTYYDEGKGRPVVALYFRIVPPADGRLEPFEAVTLINGQTQKDAPAIDLEKKTVVVKFTPQAKDNQVQVQIKNRWRGPESSSAVPIQFLRPPFGLKFVEPPQKSMDPVVALQARVQSALPLTPSQIEGLVNGQPIRNVKVKKEEGETWLIDLRDVSLKDVRGSLNNVTLRVKNAEGSVRAPAETTVAFLGKPLERPEVVLLEPADSNVTDPNIPVRFLVRSAIPLKRVALILENTMAVQPFDLEGLPDPREVRISVQLTGEGALEPVQLAKLPMDGQGFRKGITALGLSEGLNPIRVEATNEGGDKIVSRVVTFQPPPIRLAIDSLEPAEGGASVPYLTQEGKFASEAPQGKMLLKGRVVWGRDNDERLKKGHVVQLRVNGSRQIGGVVLEPADPSKPRERRFQAPLYFSQNSGNRIFVDLPGLELDDSNRREFLADCAQPVEEKRLLHLLIVGIGAEDETSLRAQVLRALQARLLSPREMQVKNYQGGLIYGPVVGEVEPDQVYLEVANIHRKINGLAKQGAYNNVVMVYFQGKEIINDKGHFLLTRLESGFDPDSSMITCESLEKRLLETLGAQLLIMDVMRDPVATLVRTMNRGKDRIANLSVDTPIAVFRTVDMTRNKAVPPAYLIQALENAWPNTKRLADFAEQVTNSIQQVRRDQPETILYDPFVPPSLRFLHIGPGME